VALKSEEQIRAEIEALARDMMDDVTFLTEISQITRELEEKHGPKLGDARHKLHVAMLDLMDEVFEEAKREGV
jgi:hypothetical protein